MECKALGWPYSLAHEAIMVANVIQHFFSIKVVDTDGMLRRCTGGGEEWGKLREIMSIMSHAYSSNAKFIASTDTHTYHPKRGALG